MWLLLPLVTRDHCGVPRVLVLCEHHWGNLLEKQILRLSPGPTKLEILGWAQQSLP